MSGISFTIKDQTTLLNLWSVDACSSFELHSSSSGVRFKSQAAQKKKKKDVQKQVTDGQRNPSWTRQKVATRRRGIICVCWGGRYHCRLYSISWTSSSPIVAQIGASKHAGSDELISCGLLRVLTVSHHPPGFPHTLILWFHSPLTNETKVP